MTYSAIGLLLGLVLQYHWLLIPRRGRSFAWAQAWARAGTAIALIGVSAAGIPSDGWVTVMLGLVVMPGMLLHAARTDGRFAE